MPRAPAGLIFMNNEMLVVVRCAIGDESGWMVVGIPRDEPDVSVFQGYERSVPVGWANYGIFYDRDQAVDHAKRLDYLISAAASFEAGRKGS